jgi:acyl-coenzyme A synthetase/AMP-(fatty) acid ligase
MRVEVIRITDEPIAAWDDDLRVADGTVGEFAVAGPVVTRGYFQRPVATRLAKIAAAAPDAPAMHRMGDVGYRDQLGRLWFCGRKAHRVMTPEGVLFTIPCEAVFNTHPEVIRTALVGVGPAWKTRPVLCVEPLHWPLKRKTRLRLTKELLALGAEHAHTRSIQHVLFRGSFPVDIRHNAKIFREKLAAWAARRLRWG